MSKIMETIIKDQLLEYMLSKKSFLNTSMNFCDTALLLHNTLECTMSLDSWPRTNNIDVVYTNFVRHLTVLYFLSYFLNNTTVVSLVNNFLGFLVNHCSTLCAFL